MEAVEACCHEEDRRIDPVGKAERCMAVFNTLKDSKECPKCNRDHQTDDEIAAVILNQRMVRPCHRTARQQQDQRVDQRQIKGVEGLNAFRWPDPANRNSARSKKAQKKATKNITSDEMNSIMP